MFSIKVLKPPSIYLEFLFQTFQILQNQLHQYTVCLASVRRPVWKRNKFSLETKSSFFQFSSNTKENEKKISFNPTGFNWLSVCNDAWQLYVTIHFTFKVFSLKMLMLINTEKLHFLLVHPSSKTEKTITHKLIRDFQHVIKEKIKKSFFDH